METKKTDHENVASERHPFKIKHTKVFLWPASGGELGRGWTQGSRQEESEEQI